MVDFLINLRLKYGFKIDVPRIENQDVKARIITIIIMMFHQQLNTS